MKECFTLNTTEENEREGKSGGQSQGSRQPCAASATRLFCWVINETAGDLEHETPAQDRGQAPTE